MSHNRTVKTKRTIKQRSAAALKGWRTKKLMAAARDAARKEAKRKTNG